MQFFSGLVDFVKSRYFWIHLALAGTFTFLVLFFTYNWLNSYTKHSESITVPDLRGMHAEQLEEFLSARHLRFAIVDSVFELGKEPRVVMQQDPLPDAKVKENRTVYLTINSLVPPKTSMPNLIDVSERQAIAMLESAGLQKGKISYKPDVYKAVLSQQVNGKEVKEGESISKGSVVDLVIGDGIGISKVKIPMLIGLTRSEALFVLKASSLNAGNIFNDETVRDSLAAKVYRQVPEYADSVMISQGEPIDLYFTQSEEKIITPEKHE